MDIGRLFRAFFMAAIVGTMLATYASADDAKFTQDRFAIGFWVDPPADANMDRHYADIAAANFTMVLGGFGARTPKTVRRQIALCEKHDLKVVVGRAGFAPEKLPESPVVWGYAIRDEPSAKDFPALRTSGRSDTASPAGKTGLYQLIPQLRERAPVGNQDLRRARSTVL